MSLEASNDPCIKRLNERCQVRLEVLYLNIAWQKVDEVATEVVNRETDMVVLPPHLQIKCFYPADIQ